MWLKFSCVDETKLAVESNLTSKTLPGHFNYQGFGFAELIKKLQISAGAFCIELN